MDRSQRGFRIPVRGVALTGIVACAIALAGLGMVEADPVDVTAGGATLTMTDAPDGLLVTSLETGGRSQAIGLRVGDVIDRVDGRDAPTPAVLLRAEAGDVATLHVAARGDAAARTLLLRRPQEGQGEDSDRRGR
ncbi:MULTISPECIES: PDZ domain-containing protein [unclassified Sphingomonas]|uniref:PDZ domain-containing protein n=1 Tax=unclassified Sphingomonas TaxID=196159 RepID=UPI000A865091|nr:MULTISPECIES: PDZ domain-containing protein [unclassified Sphingomonas]